MCVFTPSPERSNEEVTLRTALGVVGVVFIGGIALIIFSLAMFHTASLVAKWLGLL